jgi:hypothetical protein
MKNFFKILIISSFVFLIGATSTLAVTTGVDSTSSPVLSSVSVHNAKIVSQDNNKLKISFDLTNGKKVQTGVNYGIKIIKETDKGQFVVDEKTYNESMTLAENKTEKKEITYTAPKNLDGEYSILIISRNNNGYIFGLAFVGKVTFTRTFKGLEFVTETCRLSIVGEKYYTYSLIQGVDISKEENLQLNCTVTNTSETEITAKPSFETHFRTIYGEIVPQTEVTNEPISVKPGEEKKVSIILPKATAPQAYDVKTILEYGLQESNEIIAHYVIQGVGATIQNLSLDKDFYREGETANMFFSWSSAAGNFEGSRLGKKNEMPEIYLSALITNKLGANCAEPIKQVLSTDHNTMKNNIPVPITKNCTNPKLQVELTDKEGNIFSEKIFNVETTTKKNPVNSSLWIIITALSLICLAVVLYIKNLKKNSKGPNDPNNPNQPTSNIPSAVTALVLLLAILIGFNYPPLESLAVDIDGTSFVINGGGTGTTGVVVTDTTTDTTTVTTAGGMGVTPEGLSASLSLNKAVPLYDPDLDSSIDVTTMIYYNVCDNGARNIIATGIVQGENYSSSPQTMFDSVVSMSDGRIFKTVNFSVPPVGGDYRIHMAVNGYIPYMVYDSQRYLMGANIKTGTFAELKTELINYINAFYPEAQAAYYGVMSTNSLEEVASVLMYNLPELTVNPSTAGDLSFTRYYDIALKVKGVTVSANEASPSTTVNSGQDVRVRWNSIYVTSCTCTCENESGGIINCGSTNSSSCGNGISNPQESTPYPIPGVTQKTNFHVFCQ